VRPRWNFQSILLRHQRTLYLVVFWLARVAFSFYGGAMFCVDEATAEAIRRAFNEEGELSALIEFRRHFPLITDNAKGRECVRIIAGWQPALPPAKAEDKVVRLRPRRRPTP